MGYFTGTDFFSKNAIEHRAKYGTANSVSEEKGTDNKKNNTSEYNHKYYEGHKEKWKKNKKSSKKENSSKSDNDDLYYDKDGKARFGHKDYDENDEDFKRTDGEKIEGTDLRTFTNKNGSTIILGKGIKFSFPPGTKITTAMAKKIAAIEGGDKSNKEAYVAKMLNAVTGFADKQKLFPTEKKSSKKGSSKKSKSKTSEQKQSSGGSSSSGNRDWNRVKSDYYSNKSTTKKKTSEELKKDIQTRGKLQTKYYKKKYKSQNYKATSKTIKHYDDLGSIPIRDLF